MRDPDPDAPRGGDDPTADLLLPAAGLVYLGAGVVFAVAYAAGGVTSSLFPAGWILPAVLIVSGALMTARRRFDIVATLWAGLTLAVFLIDMQLHVRGEELGVSDPAAFDASLIVGALGLVTLVLRPRFRS